MGVDDIDHAFMVGAYLHFCDGEFENIQACDGSFVDSNMM
jgi:hypothetical protein